jgi:hypothetical protein
MHDPKLQKGDWVQTDTGAKGQVALVSGLTVFVEIPATEGGSHIVGCLRSALMKVEPPESPMNRH